MDVLGTVWWLISGALSLVWSLVWFLISGWVATVAQLLIVIGLIFGFKYGWRRAPFEAWRSLRGIGRVGWAWIRARDLGRADNARVETRDVIREIRVKEWGDVNLSTLLSLAALAGLIALRLLSS